MAKMTVEQVKKLVAHKKSDRSLWELLWQDIGDYIFTRKSNVLIKKTEGEDRQVFLYDNTGPQSLELFAGIMMSILMSIEEMWFEVTSGETDIDNLDHVKAYLQKTTRTVHNVMANSNFYTEAHEMLLDLGGFGTNIFGIEEDDNEIIRYFAKFIAEGYIGENSRGKVDEVYLEFDWTASQIVSEYGEKGLPKEVLKAYTNQEEKKFKVVHAIYPVERDKLAQNAKGHGYHSQHCLTELNHELRIGSFKSFPYAVPRFSKATGETYGRSPGMIALPEVKVLNKMVETTLIGAEKVIDPPLQAPDDGFITQINTFPASISYYRAGSNDRIEPIFNDSRIDFGFQMIEEKQNKIKDAFYINQMMLPQKNGNPATATEVSQRVEQSMRFMGPFLARMQKEFLQVVVDRTIEICFNKGVLKKEDIPQELQGKGFTVKYTSFIAKAQRMGGLQNIMRFWQSLEPLINIDPSARHYVNSTGTVKAVASILGIPHEMLNSDKDVLQLKQQEQQAQQQAQQAQTNAANVEAQAKMAQAAQAPQQG